MLFWILKKLLNWVLIRFLSSYIVTGATGLIIMTRSEIIA